MRDGPPSQLQQLGKAQPGDGSGHRQLDQHLAPLRTTIQNV